MVLFRVIAVILLFNAVVKFSNIYMFVEKSMSITKKYIPL